MGKRQPVELTGERAENTQCQRTRGVRVLGWQVSIALYPALTNCAIRLKYEEAPVSPGQPQTKHFPSLGASSSREGRGGICAQGYRLWIQHSNQSTCTRAETNNYSCGTFLVPVAVVFVSRFAAKIHLQNLRKQAEERTQICLSALLLQVLTRVALIGVTTRSPWSGGQLVSRKNTAR